MNAVFQLRPYADATGAIWTREDAARVRADLEVLLDQTEPGDIVTIDLEGVKVFDFSFANELFGRTALNLANDHPGRFVVVESLSTYTRQNLQKALEDTGVMMVERTKQKLKLIGKVHPADEATFEMLLRAKQPVTATTLKDALGIALTAMNERLAKLSKFGVLQREITSSEAGREQYEYSTP
jgi:hypothetical protein